MKILYSGNEGVNIIKGMDVFFDPFNVFIPPLYFQEFLNLFWSKAVFYNPGRGADCDRIRRNIVGDKGFGADNSAIANRNALFHTDIISHPDVIANDHFVICTVNGGFFHSNTL